MVMDAPEKDLVAGLKSDNAGAFNELFRRYNARIYQMAMRFLPYKEDGEEIVQVVFIALWNNRKKIDPDQNFNAYIGSIARHSIYNALRKAVYRQAYFDYLYHHTSDHTYITEEVVLYDELDSVLHKCMEALPPKRREIFRLFREEGLSYKEISDRLSITASTVNTQLTKAIDFIRRSIRLEYEER